MKTPATRGFTLIELTITVVLVAGVAGLIAGAVQTLATQDRLSAAYAEDLAGLRRAVRRLRADLQTHPDPARHAWRLEDGVLSRRGEVVARHLARFDVRRAGRLAHVELQLAPRTRPAHRREAVASFTVRLRAPEEEGR